MWLRPNVAFVVLLYGQILLIDALIVKNRTFNDRVSSYGDDSSLIEFEDDSLLIPRASARQESGVSMLIRMTQHGMQQLVEMAGNEVLRFLQGVKMADIGIPMDGGVLRITDLKLNGVNAKFSHRFEPPARLRWALTNGKASVSGKWEYWKLKSENDTDPPKNIMEGSFRLHMVNTLANLSYSLKQADNGFILPYDMKCDQVQGDIKFNTQGAIFYSQEYSVTIDSGKILPNYANLLCATGKIYLLDTVNEIGKAFGSLLPMGSEGNLYLNATVDGEPTLSDSYLDIPLKSIVMGKYHGQPPPEPMNTEACKSSNAKCLYFNSNLFNSLFMQGYYGRLFEEAVESILIDDAEQQVGVQLTAAPSLSADDAAVGTAEGVVYTKDDALPSGGAVFNATFAMDLKVSNRTIYPNIKDVAVQLETVGKWPGLRSDAAAISEAARAGVEKMLTTFTKAYPLPIPDLKTAKLTYSAPVLQGNTYMMGGRMTSLKLR